MDDFVVAVEGIADTRGLADMPANILQAAQRAVNRTADRTSTAARKKMREEINFPAQYLTGTDSSGKARLGVSKRAGNGNLEAIITGRDRPTSLARFVVGNRQPITYTERGKETDDRLGKGKVGVAGLQVQVAPGFARLMRRAFLIRLPAGRGGSLDNIGLAVRLKPHEVIHNKRVMLKLRGNLYLLYGPSIDQVFRSVREDVAPDAEAFLGSEFVRLLGLNS